MTSLLAFLTWIPERIWEAISGRRRVSVTAHEARFENADPACMFLTVTNCSRDREVEISHVWIAAHDYIPVRPADRPLPKPLRPDESWATWIRADALPAGLGDARFALGRVRLSSGRVVESRRATSMPPVGAVPGGPISNPWA
jgi:hypothetical protein